MNAHTHYPLENQGNQFEKPLSIAALNKGFQFAANHFFMKAAIQEAKWAEAQGNVPIGAVLVQNGRVIGKGRCKRESSDGGFTPAQIQCLDNAGELKTARGTVLFTTLAPGPEAIRSILSLGIKKVVVGESETFKAKTHWLTSRGVDFIDLNMNECKNLMKDFIANYPNLWNQVNQCL